MPARHTWATMALIALSTTAWADPCVTQANTQEMNACARQQLDAADARLNEAYTALKAALPAENTPGVAGPSPRLALRDAQRAWITFRDADCAAQAQLYAGGSIVTLIHLGCLQQRTEQRTRELQRDQWLPGG
ncbi:lysozyme inhibitor LprI family protein [Nitrogeniibacter aestuarii]|uniref:lysozyme inhibitor LprI family protein n=1 Tax=Nitrogeniibacter aestuarii TaxID=2815343 RepID=UPI001E596747|nr:lysozyme inhibitor LprI family protein [Nitrogeniibacter aestuarii]